MNRFDAKRITLGILPQVEMFSVELLVAALCCANRPGDVFKYSGVVYEVMEHMTTVNIVKVRRRHDVPPFGLPDLKTRLDLRRTSWLRQQ